MEPQPGSGSKGDNSRILGVVVLWPWSVCHLQLLGMAVMVPGMGYDWGANGHQLGIFWSFWMVPTINYFRDNFDDTQILSYSVSFLANQTSLAPISSGNKDCLFGFLGQWISNIGRNHHLYINLSDHKYIGDQYEYIIHDYTMFVTFDFYRFTFWGSLSL